MISGPMKGLVAWALGIDKNDELFSEIKDPEDFLGKVGRFFTLFYQNFFNVIFRIISLSIAVMCCYKFLYKPHLSGYVPTLREISFLPLLAIKDILTFTGVVKFLPPYS